MENYYEKLIRARDAVRAKTDFQPRIGLILGSGLGPVAETMDVVTAVDYKDIPGFPVSTVPGHAGRYLFGYIGGVPVVCMQGRVHYYEGFDVHDVVMPTRVMGLLGIKTLFLTNAAGGVGEEEGLDAQKAHDPGGHHHVVDVEALIVVDPALHAHHRHAADIAEEVPARVARHGGHGEAGDVLIVHGGHHVHGLRHRAQAGAQDQADAGLKVGLCPDRVPGTDELFVIVLHINVLP